MQKYKIQKIVRIVEAIVSTTKNIRWYGVYGCSFESYIRRTMSSMTRAIELMKAPVPPPRK